MGKNISIASWVWVIISDPGKNEEIVGQHDQNKGIDFIPTFMTKDEAMQGFMNLPREKGHKYEVQAIIFEDLAEYAKHNGFKILFLDEDGKVLDNKITDL